MKKQTIVFRSQISKQAGRLKVNIPEAARDLALPLWGKKVKVTLEVVEE